MFVSVFFFFQYTHQIYTSNDSFITNLNKIHAVR